jgi:hypothetical protein
MTLSRKKHFFCGKNQPVEHGRAFTDRAIVLFDQVVQKTARCVVGAQRRKPSSSASLARPKMLALNDEVVKSDARNLKTGSASAPGRTFFLRTEGGNFQGHRNYAPTWRRTRTTGRMRNQALFKKASAEKRKTTAPARSRRFIKFLTKKRANTDNGVNSSGTTRPDLMPHGFWRKIRNGSVRGCDLRAPGRGGW